MTRRSEPKWTPPTPGRRGPGRSYDPFYEFEQLARDHGHQPKARPEPKAELALLSLLGSKTALAVMSCVLVFVVAALLVLMAVKL